VGNINRLIVCLKMDNCWSKELNSGIGCPRSIRTADSISMVHDSNIVSFAR